MFRGWYVVAAAFLIAVWSWGLAFYGLGIYLVALGQQHGWSISAVSIAITVYYLMGAAATASVGSAMRRLGPHRTVAGGVLAMAAGVASLGSISRLWQFYAALAAMALGWACMSGAAINILVAPWFERKRGVAVSLALTGASGGGVIVAPGLLWLIAHHGFGPAVRIAAMVMIATLLPVAVIVLRRAPGELGLAPDGDPAPRAEAPSGPHTTEARRFEALRTRRYWTISIAFATGLAAQVGVLTHLVSHLTPVLGPAGAGGALSLSTVAAIAGRVPMGALADRMDRRLIAGLNFLLQVVGLACLSLTSSTAALYAGCVLFGLGVGNVITLPGLLVEREFPREQFASVVSLITATNQLAFAFAPGLIGLLRDATGGYGLALGLCAGADLLAAAIVVAGRTRRRAAADDAGMEARAGERAATAPAGAGERQAMPEARAEWEAMAPARAGDRATIPPAGAAEREATGDARAGQPEAMGEARAGEREAAPRAAPAIGLALRPNCECCDRDLPPDSPDAVICSFECTFCRWCADRLLGWRCPNCGGELVRRPIRLSAALARHPASTARVTKPEPCASRTRAGSPTAA